MHVRMLSAERRDKDDLVRVCKQITKKHTHNMLSCILFPRWTRITICVSVCLCVCLSVCMCVCLFSLSLSLSLSHTHTHTHQSRVRFLKSERKFAHTKTDIKGFWATWSHLNGSWSISRRVLVIQTLLAATAAVAMAKHCVNVS